MAIMKDKITRFLRHALLLCLCMALLAGSALANDVVDISTDGYDQMHDECMLPDGRIIFAGSMGMVGNYVDSRARLVCMNPDMTVSWEYVDPEEGCCSFRSVVVLKDGTIGAVLDNSPYQNPVGKKLKFFTQDGQPTGKEIVLSDAESMSLGANASCILLISIPEGRESYYEFIDWDGNVILSYENKQSPMSGFDMMIEEEDGLVFAGAERGPNDYARILKMDLQGKVLWETVLPILQEGAVESRLMDLVQSDDGGYLGLLHEYGPYDQHGVTKVSSYSIVKFNANGRLLWRNSTAFDGRKDMWAGILTRYNGKLVTEIEQLHTVNYHGTEPHVFLWMDEEGNSLGTTELNLKQEELPRLSGAKKLDEIGGYFLIPTKDGLWGMNLFNEDCRDHMKAQDSMDELLVKIPEL